MKPVDPERVLPWLEREIFWQQREAANCGNENLSCYFKGAAWAFAKVLKKMQEEADVKPKKKIQFHDQRETGGSQ